MYFCHIENFAYGENNERSFSNPHFWTPVTLYSLWTCITGGVHVMVKFDVCFQISV